MKINENYKNLEESYLFSTIAKKVDEYTKAHPEAKVIKMGIGDVTLPICQKAADAFAKAAMEQGKAATFHGYGPEQGYDFLRVAVQKYYASFQVEVAAEDIFISDGAKSDVGNILDLFDADNTVLIPDPVYRLHGYERDGRQKDRIYGCQCGKWLSSDASEGTESGYYLSLLPEQPDWRCVQP